MPGSDRRGATTKEGSVIMLPQKILLVNRILEVVYV